MLPETLSSGICSLFPDVDRLVQSVRLRIGPDGRLREARFFHGVIRSAVRLSYEDGTRLLTGTDSGPIGGGRPDHGTRCCAVCESARGPGGGGSRSARARGYRGCRGKPGGRPLRGKKRRPPAGRGLHAAREPGGSRTVAKHGHSGAPPGSRGSRRDPDRFLRRPAGRFRRTAARSLRAAPSGPLRPAAGPHRGPARSALPAPQAAPGDAEGGVFTPRAGALRARASGLHALHLADPAVPGPRGASRARRGGSRVVPGPGTRDPRRPSARRAPRPSGTPRRRNGPWSNGVSRGFWPAGSATSSPRGFPETGRFGLAIELDEIPARGTVPMALLTGGRFRFHRQDYSLRCAATGRSFRIGDALDAQLVRVDPLRGDLEFGLFAEPARVTGKRDRGPRPRRARPR